MAGVEGAVGRRFGDPATRLLVSVRSGAPVSMPGMMDTILDLGLNDATTGGLAAVSGDDAFAEACRGRFVESFRSIVGVEDVPDDPWQQLRLAIEAVFRSWQSDRAQAYRAKEGIPDDLGTAVTVQAMVFGNRGTDSGTGVVFTRNPATGERQLFGDILFDAQGEDVVAGTHRTEPIAVLDERLPAVAAELRATADRLERHYADLCDIEFTIEEGRLWLLQVRVGKRSPQAAVRIAVDMAEDPDFPLTREEAVRRVLPLLADPPRIAVARDDGIRPILSGLAASPGVASGPIVTSPEAAQAAAEQDRPAILVRAETSPDDVHGMAAAAGILTARGGLASHAAVVARGWGIPAVVGAEALEVADGEIRIDGRVLRTGELLTIDGGTGEVFEGEVAGSTEVAPEARTLLEWARAEGIEIEDDAPSPEPAPSRDRPIDAERVLRSIAIKGFALPDGVADAVLSSAERGPARRRWPDRRRSRRVDRRRVPAHRRRPRSIGRAARSGARNVDGRGGDRGARRLPRHRSSRQGRRSRPGSCATARRRTTTPMPTTTRRSSIASSRSTPTLPTGSRRSTAGCPRLADYGVRLRRAIDAAKAGDGRFVASPRVDSYHGAWFELHEDLIQLAGRTREDETAAGRA